MKVAILGTGYVGLVTGCGLAKLGHDVVCLDVDGEKIDALKSGKAPFFEPDIQSLLTEVMTKGALSFASDVAAHLANKDLIFLAVGTPSLASGDADLSYVFSAIEMIAKHGDPATLIVTKSTVPVGTNREVANKFRALAPNKKLRVVSNPEFLREGSAVTDFFKPDRVVVGVADDAEAEQLRKLYAPLFEQNEELQFIVGNWESAELVKYASNSFLATKVAFINELADISESVRANVDVVAAGMGSDPRIGSAFLNSGPGYGGSCFPKDMLALLATAQRVGLPAQIVQSTIAANEGRMRSWAKRISDHIGHPLDGLRIAQLGLSFKANTDDVRASPAMLLARSLIARSVDLRAYDPQGNQNALQDMPNLNIADSALACAEGAEALVIATEWPEFGDLDLQQLRNTMRGDWIFDLRGVLESSSVTKAGFIHYRVGHEIAYPDNLEI